MNINSRTVSGKKFISILFTLTLISNAGFLTQTAHAGNMPPMTPEQMKNMQVAKSAPVPAVTTAPTVTQVTGVAGATTSYKYSASIGKTYANTKMAVVVSTKVKGVKVVTKLGSFKGDAKGVFTLKAKAKIASSAFVTFSAVGMKSITIPATKLKLVPAPKSDTGAIAAPFVSPTPTPTPTPTPVAPVAPVVPVIEDARVPTFGVPNPTTDGYTLQIANFDSAFAWTAKDAAGGTLTISSTGQITVTNLAPSTITKVTVTTTRTNYNTGTATSVAITVLAPPPPAGGGVFVLPPPPPPVVPPVVTPVDTRTAIVAPVITLAPTSEIITIGSPILGYTLSLSKTGGAATSYSIFPAAPAGTVFSTTLGTLTGTPLAQQPATAYQITAINTAGFSNAVYTLTVNALPSAGGGTASQVLYVAQPVAMRVGSTDQVLTGISTSGLPITYVSSNLAVCTVSTGSRVSVVHAVAAGTCTLTATQLGNATFGIATNVVISLQVIDTASTSVIVVLDPNGGSDGVNSSRVSLIVPPTPATIALPTTLTSTGYTSYTWHVSNVNGALAANTFPVPTVDTVLVAKWA